MQCSSETVSGEDELCRIYSVGVSYFPWSQLLSNYNVLIMTQSYTYHSVLKVTKSKIKLLKVKIILGKQKCWRYSYICLLDPEQIALLILNTFKALLYKLFSEIIFFLKCDHPKDWKLTILRKNSFFYQQNVKWTWVWTVFW